MDVTKRFDGSTGSLPPVTVRILDAEEVAADELFLFANAPNLPSSGEPYDVTPPTDPPALEIEPAP